MSAHFDWPCQLHSSFQQSTMGNWELLHHLAGFVCFVAESWPVSLCFSLPSLPVFIWLNFYYTYSLFSLLCSDNKTRQSQTGLPHWCIYTMWHYSFHSETEFHNSFMFRTVVHRYVYVSHKLSWYICVKNDSFYRTNVSAEYREIWGSNVAVKAA